MAIDIVVVDDHPIVRDGLVAVLATQPDFEVVGEASSGPEAIQCVGASKPDVILLDLEMPDMDGVETLRRLREIDPAVRLIVFTAFDTDERIVKAVQAGAQGYLLKGVPRDEIFNAIRVVHAGGALLQPVVASKLLRQVTRDAQPEADPLTERELEVLRLMAQGISERTVKFHVSAILSKLGAGNRTEAVTLAAQQGLIELK
jgi:NarL family two-component system response regulator LiaR